MRTSNNQSPLKDPQGGGFLQHRKIALPLDSRLTNKLILDLNGFLESVSANRLSRGLRNVFLLYLSSCEKEDDLPSAFEETIVDLYFPLEFLDNAAEELGKTEEIEDEKELAEKETPA